jgi:glycosyltransferase involved in cell wall biosynthesis
MGRLVELDRDTTYVFYMDAAAIDVHELPEGIELRAIRLRQKAVEGPVAGTSRNVFDLCRLARAASRRDLEAFLFPSVLTYFPVLRVPTILGLHDTTGESHPQLLFATQRERLFWRVKQATALRLASSIFAVSVAARDAGAQRYGLDAEQIPVVGEAPDPVFSPRTEVEAARAAKAIGVPPGDPYLVYAAGLSPHKNVETLIDAVAMLSGPLRLVLAGDIDGDPYHSAADSIRSRIANLRLEDRILLPGFVPDDELAALYTGAVAAVVPSLSEGFGLPAVEAAACGTAVVLSDLPAHRETLGGTALFFKPMDVTTLARELERLCTDENLRRSVGAAARQAVARLSWDASAERLRLVIANTVLGRRRG